MSKILIIDDEEDIVRVLSISLRTDGYEVVSALSGEEGLEVYHKESPDIVLTDIKMPGMDGIEVLRNIKEDGGDAEVIIITGHGDIDSAIEALKYGASDFINKPVRDEALSIALKRAEDKIEIKRKLHEYTHNLEKEIEAATMQLRRQSDFLGRLIQSSNDGIVATGDDFKVAIFNPGAVRIFGYQPDEIIGIKDCFSLYPPEIADIFRNSSNASKKISDPMPWKEITITSKEGTLIPVRFAGAPVYERETFLGSVAFFQDLREIKRLEKELVNSERLAAIGQTVAGLAHGIKNILHGLEGGSYIVDLGIRRNDTEKLKSGWDMIKRNISRTSNLVLDLLAYSKERAPEYKECSPNDIVEEVCELLHERARENDIEILKEIDTSIGKVLMDSHTIHNALMNLMTNALDACLFDENRKDHWQVRIRTDREEDNTIRFTVEDTGIGMDSETKNKLFSSFFSTKGHRGTGLGLMVTRKLVEEHNGRIDVKSQLGKGTIFTIRLPYKATIEV